MPVLARSKFSSSRVPIANINRIVTRYNVDHLTSRTNTSLVMSILCSQTWVCVYLWIMILEIACMIISSKLVVQIIKNVFWINYKTKSKINRECLIVAQRGLINLSTSLYLHTNAKRTKIDFLFISIIWTVLLLVRLHTTDNWCTGFAIPDTSRLTFAVQLDCPECWQPLRFDRCYVSTLILSCIFYFPTIRLLPNWIFRYIEQ